MLYTKGNILLVWLSSKFLAISVRGAITHGHQDSIAKSQKFARNARVLIGIDLRRHNNLLRSVAVA